MLNQSRAQGSVERAVFGSMGGHEISLYTLTNQSGCVLKATNYGATVTELHVPDQFGNLADVVLGFESLDQYVRSESYFGSIVGRVANRIKNGLFELEGRAYELERNDGAHHSHGGTSGFNRALWTAIPSLTAEGPALELHLESKDGDQGYPGALSATVTYRLTNESEFRVEMQAEASRTTIVNLAHHSCFNLAGHDSGPIFLQELELNANEYTLVDVETGIIKPVDGTALDFTTPKPIGRDLERVGNQPAGYDHNFIVLGTPGEISRVARVRDPKSGRVMTLESDQPGVQFSSGSFLNGVDRGKGACYEQYAGFCLVSQKYPYAINVPSWKNQVILRAGEIYRHRMVHRFSVEQEIS